MDNNNFEQTDLQPNNGPQLEAPMTLGDWIITLIVLAIPCVNVIMMFVWGFGKEGNISRKNYCRAALIFAAVSIFLGIIFSSVLAALIASVSSSYSF